LGSVRSFSMMPDDGVDLALDAVKTTGGWLRSLRIFSSAGFHCTHEVPF
jgi:hypothetical protein